MWGKGPIAVQFLDLAKINNAEVWARQEQQDQMEACTHNPEALRNIDTGMKINSLDSVKHFGSIEIEVPITQRQEALDHCWDHGYRITRSGPTIKG